jgi:hypothetical protein
MPRFLEPAVASPRARRFAGEQSPAAAFAFEELAQRIEGDTPVDVRGVALTRLLLTNGAGSIYSHVPAELVLNAVSQAFGALTPCSPSV